MNRNCEKSIWCCNVCCRGPGTWQRMVSVDSLQLVWCRHPAGFQHTTWMPSWTGTIHAGDHAKYILQNTCYKSSNDTKCNQEASDQPVKNRCRHHSAQHPLGQDLFDMLPGHRGFGCACSHHIVGLGELHKSLAPKGWSHLAQPYPNTIALQAVGRWQEYQQSHVDWCCECFQRWCNSECNKCKTLTAIKKEGLFKRVADMNSLWFMKNWSTRTNIQIHCMLKVGHTMTMMRLQAISYIYI